MKPIISCHFWHCVKQRRKTDYCDHCHLHTASAVPAFWADEADVCGKLGSYMPEYFKTFDDRPSTKRLVERGCTSDYSKKMANFIGWNWTNQSAKVERNFVVPDKSRVALHNDEAKAATLLKHHAKILKSFEWHRRSVRATVRSGKFENASAIFHWRRGSFSEARTPKNVPGPPKPQVKPPEHRFSRVAPAAHQPPRASVTPGGGSSPPTLYDCIYRENVGGPGVPHPISECLFCKLMVYRTCEGSILLCSCERDGATKTIDDRYGNQHLWFAGSIVLCVWERDGAARIIESVYGRDRCEDRIEIPEAV